MFALPRCILVACLHKLQTLAYHLSTTQHQYVQIAWCEDALDLSFPVYRAQAVTMVVNAFRMWPLLQAMLPPLEWRRSLYKPILRPDKKTTIVYTMDE